MSWTVGDMTFTANGALAAKVRVKITAGSTTEPPRSRSQEPARSTSASLSSPRPAAHSSRFGAGSLREPTR